MTSGQGDCTGLHLNSSSGSHARTHTYEDNCQGISRPVCSSPFLFIYLMCVCGHAPMYKYFNSFGDEKRPLNLGLKCPLNVILFPGSWFICAFLACLYEQPEKPGHTNVKKSLHVVFIWRWLGSITGTSVPRRSFRPPSSRKRSAN